MKLYDIGLAVIICIGLYWVVKDQFTEPEKLCLVQIQVSETKTVSEWVPVGSEGCEELK